MRSSTQRGETVPPGAGTGSVSPGSTSRRHRRRVWLRGLLALIAVTGVLAFVLLIQAGTIRADLERARSAMERGRDQLLAGDASQATASFEQGRDLFSSAAGRSRSWVLGGVAWIPVAGRTADVLTAMAEAGEKTAEAATLLSGAVADLPGGLAALAPTRGALPLDLIPRLAEAAGEADRLMSDAVSKIDEASDSLLIGPVAPARRAAEDELRDLRRDIHAAASLLRGLPGFLGADGPRHYFFGAQNPAELRGTGGLVGAYSVLTIDEGRFSFRPFLPTSSLPAPRPGEVPPANDDYAANYQEFRGPDRFWSAINVMPDLPSVSHVILDSYEAGTGEPLDGVILVDPFALAALLEATGPVELPGYDMQIDAGNVVAFTTNEAYSLLTDPTARKRILGDVARAAFGRFLAQPSADLEDLRTLLEMAADRHIQVYSQDPVMQEGLLDTPVSGALVAAGAEDDFLSVVVNSAAGSKVDYYEQRTIRHSVSLRADGSASETTELVLRNHAPRSGQPPYVIGPFHPEHVGPILRTLEAGESVALVNVYCGTQCVPGDTRMDGAPVQAGTRADLGVRYVQRYFAIQSGRERTLQVSWATPRAWEGNSSGGVYRMTFANQVTIRPAYVRIRIDPPAGMHIVSVSDPMRVVDGSAVYEGVPGSRLDLEVAFAPSLPDRLWRNVARFLTTPVF